MIIKGSEELKLLTEVEPGETGLIPALNNSDARFCGLCIYFSSNVTVLRNLAVRLPMVVIYLPAYRHFLFS